MVAIECMHGMRSSTAQLPPHDVAVNNACKQCKPDNASVSIRPRKRKKLSGFLKGSLIPAQSTELIWLTFSFLIKIFCFKFKGWNQPYHQPVLKFPLFLPARQQEKSVGISKIVDDKAGSIL